MNKEEYNDYVKQVTPTKSCIGNCVKAFVVGGLICVLGQALTELYTSFGIDYDEAALWCSLTLIALSAIFTALGLYSKLAMWAGAGTLVPITGFSNSIAASAIEYKTEGQVFGIGCKIFTIAGPVILYGILTSWLLGLIYLVITLF